MARWKNPSFCSVTFPFKPPFSWCSHMFYRLSHHVSCCHSFPLNHPVGSWYFRCFSPRTSGGPSFDWAATHQSFTVPSCSFQKGPSLGWESNWVCVKLGKPQTWWFLIMFIDVHSSSFNFPLKIAVTWVYPPSLRQTLKWKLVLISATHHQWHGFGTSMSYFFQGKFRIQHEFLTQNQAKVHGYCPWSPSPSHSWPLWKPMNTTSAQRSWKSPA